MSNKIEGFSLDKSVARRCWKGIVADVSEVRCSPYAGGYYTARDPRLFIMLEMEGAGRQIVRRASSDRGQIQSCDNSPISFVPADMDLWVDISDMRRLRHLDVHFDADMLSQRLGDDLDPRKLQEPKLMVSDERALTLARLIAAECENGTPLHDLYGDGLVLSLIISVLNLEQPLRRSRSPLASWQLRRVTDFIEENCLRTIRLDELAALAGVSASQFSHAFKAATGSSPHHWQMKARLAHAKALLARDDHSLTEVAAETGFADQAHFTRVFRQYTGHTPARWRKYQPC